MQAVYQNLLKIMREKKSLSLYEHDLFKETSWYTQGILALKKNAPIANVSSEISETLHSLKKFVQKESETNTTEEYGEKIVKLEQAQIVIKEENSNLIEEHVDIKKVHMDDLKYFIQELKKCQNCAFLDFSKRKFVVQELDKFNGQNISVLFVGDMPKRLDGDTSLAFDGEVRELLLKMIQAMKLNEREYLFDLALKCSYEGDLEDQHLDNCIKQLYQEIMHVKPKVIVAMGARASEILLGRKEKLSKIHGNFYPIQLINQNNEKFETSIVPIFHPEFLLINPNMKKAAWADLQKVMGFIGK